MSGNILVVEDESHLAEGIRDNLEAEGHSVEIVGDGERAVERWRAGGLDLIVLDVMLPRRDGFAVCKAIRDEGGRVPILFLTARNSDEDRVRGLEIGADDYLGKPFNLRELLLRVRAMLRRQDWRRQSTPEQVARVGMSLVDLYSGEVTTAEGGRHVLAEKEALLLRLLVERAGQTVTREEVLEHVWGHEVSPSTRTMDQILGRLRRAVEPDPDQPRFLQTVRGLGYRFDPAGEGEKR